MSKVSAIYLVLQIPNSTIMHEDFAEGEAPGIY